MKNIYLVGFMGTGKSTVGKILANRMKLSFLDMDAELVNKAKMSITDIFRTKGEEHFRKLETKLLAEITKKKGLVVSTGGGVMISHENLAMMKASGHVITLAASPETVYERTKNDTSRPLLLGPEPLSEIQRLMFERAYYYIKGDTILDTTETPAEETADAIMEFVSRA